MTTACQHNWAPKWRQARALNSLSQEKGADEVSAAFRPNADLNCVTLLLPGALSPCTKAHKQPLHHSQLLFLKPAIMLTPSFITVLEVLKAIL